MNMIVCGALEVGRGPLFYLSERSPMNRVRERAYGKESHLADSVRAVAAPIIKALHLELIDVECAGHGPRSVIRVFIDKPGGVNLNDCEEVHVSLGHALDVVDPVPHAYRLEVSSPGLDRPLKHSGDYRRSIGKLLSLKLRVPYEGQWRVIGRLIDVNEQGIALERAGQDKTRSCRFDWEAIMGGRLEVEF